MPRGGYREGAGRPRGALNRRTEELLARLKRNFGKAFDPIVLLAEFATDDSNPPEFRAECAKAIAPYVHSRLKQSEVETSVAFDMTGLAERLVRAKARIEAGGNAAVIVSDPDAGAAVVEVVTGIPRTPTAPLPALPEPEPAKPEPPRGNPKFRPSTAI